ncbi:hypothetical protein CHELA20_40304 [Hyphomicrobiales bacterium]|nr:hypothetical protein CHELA20_40304 [Hyphomicrobiales bacterium]CAH1688109.1 hypothetical protein CHELA41_40161 [Hyphomicrobiales bacterium]
MRDSVHRAPGLMGEFLLRQAFLATNLSQNQTELGDSDHCAVLRWPGAALNRLNYVQMLFIRRILRIPVEIAIGFHYPLGTN